jgi:hypothetical protein
MSRLNPHGVSNLCRSTPRVPGVWLGGLQIPTGRRISLEDISCSYCAFFLCLLR